jgi:hypothetical protein
MDADRFGIVLGLLLIGFAALAAIAAGLTMERWIEAVASRAF